MLFEPLGWSIRWESSIRAMTVRDSVQGIYPAFAAVSDPDRRKVHLSFICLDRLYTSVKVAPTRFKGASSTHRSAMTAPQGFVSAVLHRVHAWLTTLILYLLALGPMPRHIGFVMDGNRRYARTKGMKVTQGHTDGFQSLRRVSEGCLHSLGLLAFTLYLVPAFRLNVDAGSLS